MTILSNRHVEIAGLPTEPMSVSAQFKGSDRLQGWLSLVRMIPEFFDGAGEKDEQYEPHNERGCLVVSIRAECSETLFACVTCDAWLAYPPCPCFATKPSRGRGDKDAALIARLIDSEPVAPDPDSRHIAAIKQSLMTGGKTP